MSVGWQRDEDDHQVARDDRSLQRGIRDRRSQSQVSTGRCVSDVTHEPELRSSMMSPETALQLVLDSCGPWAAQPATPASSLMAGYHNARQDAPETTECDSLRLGRPHSTAGSSRSIGSQADVLRNGILEELDAIKHPDFSVRHPLDEPDYHCEQAFQVDQPPPIAMPPAGDLTTNTWLDYYFERFHPRWPIIHQSTFNPATAIPDLLSMMSMIGAWEYGVTPSLEASERWSESLVLRLSHVLVRIYFLIECLQLT